MQGFGSRNWFAGVMLGVALVMAGCATSHAPAPIEDRLIGRGLQGPPVDPVKPLQGIENLGKPGYYAVRPGDTIMRIGLDTGQNWRDLVRWNSLENPNLIEVGQVLRVIPPVTSALAGVTSAPSVSSPAATDSTGVVTRPVTQSTIAAASGAASAAATTSKSMPVTPSAPTVAAAVPTPTPAPAPAAASGPEDDLGWIWPAQGTLLAGFDEVKNKGLDIGGKAGDSVLAAADGRVVYAGAGLRGYGNLIILKHNSTYLTAYAHNQTLLVKEDQSVQKGQKIAEMGNSDADRVKLHFEIRRQGKPVDPSRYLPSR